MECIFDYDLNVIECEVLNPAHNTKTLYLLFTSKEKILSDLHLLFLIRRDRENCERIREMFRDYEEGVKNLLNRGSFSSCPFFIPLLIFFKEWDPFHLIDPSSKYSLLFLKVYLILPVY